MRTLRATVWVICDDRSIGGVDNEVVGVVRDDVNGILSRRVSAHVEIAVVADSEVVTSTINKGAVSGGKVSAVTVASPGNDGVDRTRRSGVSRYVDVVIGLTLPVQDGAAPIFVFLVVEASLGEVRAIGPGAEFVDWNKGGLDNLNARGAVRIVGIGIALHFESIGSIVSVGIVIEGVSSSISSADKDSRARFHSVQKAVRITVRVGRVCAGSFFFPVVGAVIVCIRIGGVCSVEVFLRVCHPVTVKITRTKLSQVSGEKLDLIAIGNTVTIRIFVGIKGVDICTPAQAEWVGVKLGG